MTTMRRILRWTCTALLATVVRPDAAAACGGTFCDSGPTAMPVDQTGENVLFVVDQGYVEAHVQIQYQGSAERFAWVVPMPQVPEVSVGSQLLFNALLVTTTPSYGLNTSFDRCGDQCFGTGGTGGAGGAVSGGGNGGSGDPGGNGGGPSVVFTKTVGSFDVTALSGGTAQEVSDWLVANGYANVPTAPAILQDYVSKNFVFLALKLTGGADVSEIHPVVFRYQGSEPCIPLKLTAVAATEDMAVRAFFLGEDRVFPTNYKHVELNQARMDWTTQVANYKAVVSRAVDSPVANGRAFITEYAGSSSLIPPSAVYSPQWSAAPFRTARAEDTLDIVNQVGLGYCYPGACGFNHPLIAGLLERYLPPPAGVASPDFWGDLHARAADIDLTAWDAAALADAIDELIVDPAVHSSELLLRNPSLTRLYTLISPVEMTEDPEFAALPAAGVDRRNTFATRRFTCSSASGVILPDGNEVGLDPGGTWPGFTSRMPWAELVEEYGADGRQTVLVDNRSKIKSELATWNAPLAWPAPPPVFDPSACSAGGSGGASTGGSSGTGATSSNAGSGAVTSSRGGCQLGSNDSSGAWLALGLLGWIMAVRRGKRGVNPAA